MTKAETLGCAMPKPALAAPGDAPRPAAVKSPPQGVRHLKTVLTVALAITGLSAWAVALVQPWVGRAGDRGVVTVPATEMDEQRIRTASSEEEWVPARRKLPPLDLVRNPFVAAAAAAEPVRVAPTPAPAPTTSDAAAPLAESPAPQTAPKASEVLAAVKALRLEVTLAGPDGQRWAVINGHDYRQGDSVGGLKLTEIQEGKVKLEQGGIVCLLRMD